MSVTVRDVYDLTPLQQGMLFHALLEPESQLYVEQITVPFAGAVAWPAFRRAWQDVADHHDALRTSFHWSGIATPVQVVHADAQMSVDAIDLLDASGRPGPRRLADVQLADRTRGFDLERPPLFRVALVRSAPGDLALVLSFHHMILDGWSLQLVLRGLRHGVPPTGPRGGTPAASGGALPRLPPLAPVAGPRCSRTALARGAPRCGRSDPALVGGHDHHRGVRRSRSGRLPRRHRGRRARRRPEQGDAQHRGAGRVGAHARSLHRVRRCHVRDHRVGPTRRARRRRADGRVVHQHHPAPGAHRRRRRRGGMVAIRAAADGRGAAVRVLAARRRASLGRAPRRHAAVRFDRRVRELPDRGGPQRRRGRTGDVRRAYELPAECRDRARGATQAPRAVRRAPPAPLGRRAVGRALRDDARRAGRRTPPPPPRAPHAHAYRRRRHRRVAFASPTPRPSERSTRTSSARQRPTPATSPWSSATVPGPIASSTRRPKHSPNGSSMPASTSTTGSACSPSARPSS